MSSNNMNTQIDCCICMEAIVTTNCTTTSCNHTFHSDCLMKHALYNGFTCPCCRTTLAEKSKEAIAEEEEEDDYDDEDDDSLVSESDDESTYSYDEELEEQNLESVRWMFQRENGETPDGDDNVYEELDQDMKADEELKRIIYEEQREQLNDLKTELRKTKLSYDELLEACIVSQCKDFWENRPGMKSDRKVDSVVNSVHKRMIRRRTDRIRSIHAEHNRESQNQIVAWHRVENSTPQVERTERIQLQYDGMQIHQPNVRRRIESGPMTISELM
jgi:hypothetical protein